MSESTHTRQSFNTAVTAWGSAGLGQLRASAPKITGELQRTLALRVHKRDGVANMVGFRITRYTVYREKGATKGHAGAKGSKWWSSMATHVVKSGPLKGTVRQGGWRKTNPASLGRLGPKRPYIDPIIDARMPALLDIMEEHWGGAAQDLASQVRIK